MLHQEILAAAVLSDKDARFHQLMPAQVPAPAPVLGEAAAPDVPAAIGWMIVGVYATIMTLFMVTFSGSAEAVMVTGISALYLAIYLAVPAIFLRTEPASGRVDYRAFLARGMHTNTGHVSGREAAIQMLTIPVAISVAVAGICLVVTLTL